MSVQIISFNCDLKTKTGRLISSTFNRDVINAVQPGEPALLEGLARGLQDLKKGERRSISLHAQEAYGFYDPKKIVLLPRKKMPREVRIGQSVSILDRKGQARSYRVLQFHDELVSLDGNHPLAGQDLVFEIEAIDARDATPVEIAESVNLISKQLLH